MKPYPNNPDLLKPFEYLVEVGQFLIYEIEFKETSTVFSIYDDHSTHMIEQTTIEHRHCDNANFGFKSNFYFGGSCKAPIEVSIQEDLN